MYVCIYHLSFLGVMLHCHDALNVATLEQFSNNFMCLLGELASYFEPCGYPIELLSKFCLETVKKRD
jgi:hypothetical protein